MARPRQEPEGAPRSGRLVLAALLLLTLVGVGASLELTYIYHEANRDLGHVSHCHLSAKWDCDNVARSSYARLLGVPVATWGVVGYLLMALVVGRGFLPGAPRAWPLGAFGLLLAGALAVTGYLMYASFVVLQKKCLWCAVLYGVNGGLLATWVVGLRVLRIGPVAAVRRDLAWLRQELRTFGFLLGAGILLSGLAFVVGPRLGQAKGPRRSVDVDRLVHARPDAMRAASRGARQPGIRGPSHPPKWLARLVTPHTPALGPEQADLYIVEFSDYQCPFCQLSNRVMEQVLRKYGRRIRLYHRHFPLDKTCFRQMRRQMHPVACFAARAAFCAGQQGQFWQFHDAQFRLGAKISPESIRTLAGRLGLDRKRFEACLDSALARRRVQEDLAAGVRLGIRGTPTYYIGGPLVDRFQPESLSLELFDRLFAAIDRARRARPTRPRVRGSARAGGPPQGAPLGRGDEAAAPAGREAGGRGAPAGGAPR